MYTNYHGCTLLVKTDPLPEAICVAMATCNFVGKMLLTRCFRSMYSF